MADRPKAAAVIPALNEERTVGAVVRVARLSGIFDEVVVVSDGSTDRTAAVAREAGATLVHELPVNKGKGAAVAHGVSHTDAEIVCLLDADLKGLTVEHLRLITEPVFAGRRFMNMGLRDRGPFWTPIAGHLPLVGGERCLRRGIIEAIPEKHLHGFRLETALNYFCRVNGLPYGFSVLPGLHIVRKMQKVGFWRGLVGYVRMWAQVTAALVQVRCARRQFRQMGQHMAHKHR